MVTDSYALIEINQGKAGVIVIVSMNLAFLKVHESRTCRVEMIFPVSHVAAPVCNNQLAQSAE